MEVNAKTKSDHKTDTAPYRSLPQSEGFEVADKWFASSGAAVLELELELVPQRGIVVLALEQLDW